MKHISFGLLITIFFTGLCFADNPSADSVFVPGEMKACLIKHKNYFEQNSSVLGRESLDVVFSDSASPRDWKSAVFYMAGGDLGKPANRSEQVELLVAALGSGDKELVKFALSKLMWSVSHEKRKPYADQIKQVLGRNPDSLLKKWLLAKCGLNDDEKAHILQSEGGDNIVLRALCGDTDAEREIVANFKSAVDYQGMLNWVVPLAFIGSDACAQALVEGLGSTVFKEDSSLYVSIRAPILRVLGIIYEDQAELFWRCSYYVGEEGVRVRGEVNQWVHNKFGHHAWTNRFVFMSLRRITFPGECECEKAMFADEERVDTPALSSLGVEGGATDFTDKEKFSISVGGVPMGFVRVLAGSFRMGSDDFTIKEMPVHQVDIKQTFWMAETEVTQAQYEAVMGCNPSTKKGDNLPVTPLSRLDAAEFCRKLTEIEGAKGSLPKGYSYVLPSEAQWEYACRAGSDMDAITNAQDVAWCNESVKDPLVFPHPVALKKPNEWGLYDMLGNVAELCSDCYHPTYLGAPLVGERWGGPRASCYGVIRGGSVYLKEEECRPSVRYGMNINKGVHFVGFRPILQK